MVVVEKEYKNSPDDMETITMWAEKSSSNVAEPFPARESPLQSTPETLSLAPKTLPKIRKHAETAIKNDETMRQQKVHHGSGADFDAFNFSQ